MLLHLTLGASGPGNRATESRSRPRRCAAAPDCAWTYAVWRPTTRSADGASAVNFCEDDRLLSFGRVLHLWQHDSSFRDVFVSQLGLAPFAAFRWETPPVSVQTADRPFEFVLLDSPSLQRPADPRAFADPLRRRPVGRSVVAFPSLGSDALLVVPSEEVGPSAYSHLAAFSRLAPRQQQHELWETVGREMEARLSDRPLWLSTAGAGVPWLHVRLDTAPKYYRHEPYRRGLPAR